MAFIETLISFIFVLGVLVFVHELGHFLVAKKSGIRVEQFSLGFPPKAFGITVGETEYCISWLPLGGYVKVAGMSDFGSEEVKNKPWEFQSKSRAIQMAVMAAGPAMNFILGFLLILIIRLGAGEEVLQITHIGRVEDKSPLAESGLRAGDQVLSVNGAPVTDWRQLVQSLRNSPTVSMDVLRADGDAATLTVSAEPSVSLGIEPMLTSIAGTVVPGYPANQVGILSGDRIVSVDGVAVDTWTKMRQRISERAGKEIEIRWIRDNAEMSARIVPNSEESDEGTVGKIGIGPAMQPTTRIPVSFGVAIERSGQDLVGYTTLMFTVVKRLVFGEMSGRLLAGPVGIAQMAGAKARQGWEALLEFMAMLSINLAVLNLLPIPALDGGHLMILSVEAVTRRSLSSRQKEILQQAGFALLLCLMVYVTFGDISRIMGWFY